MTPPPGAFETKNNIQRPLAPGARYEETVPDYNLYPKKLMGKKCHQCASNHTRSCGSFCSSYGVKVDYAYFIKIDAICVDQSHICEREHQVAAGESSTLVMQELDHRG